MSYLNLPSCWKNISNVSRALEKPRERNTSNFYIVLSGVPLPQIPNSFVVVVVVVVVFSSLFCIPM